MRDNCRQHAAALTYTTLFAVVPMMTVLFTALAAVPTLKHVSGDIQHFIFSNLVPSTGETVQAYLAEFAHQASQLTIVGVIMLFVTAIMMLATIERAFNEIWQVRAPRQGMVSFLRYWA
ncbi:MAG: YihY family inner membrane protein, partial [Perlucidibaca sp.]